MNQKIREILIHVLGWILLFIIPYVSTRQVINSFAPDPSQISSLPILILSSILMSFFYINYYVLIPRFLLKNKIRTYVILLICIVLGAIGISFVFSFHIDINKIYNTENAVVLQKLSPIANAVTFLMFLVTIAVTVLLTLNKKLQRSEKEKFAAQISSLKLQMNPHFVFNTLNSIYAETIDIAPKAADMIEKLAHMMRYTMLETPKDFVALAAEIQYIESYIELQKKRIDERAKLDYLIKIDEENGFLIAPMLIIPFVENAFKYGINPEQDSFIDISISTIDSTLILNIKNSIVEIQHDTTESNGLGIHNTKKRLEFLYPDKFTLEIKNTGGSFHVLLKIQLL